VVYTQPGVVGENRLLAALPADEYTSLLPRLELVHLPSGQAIEQPGEPVTHAYFPRTGMLVLVAQLDDGAGVGVATIGNEGMVGLPLILASASTRTWTVCKLPGEALRLEASTFEELVQGSGAFRRLLYGYVHARYDQMVQNAACNRHHSTKARCVRWLLATQDRVQADQFPLTHEFLSNMLGVRRTTISLTASALQQAGLIRYRRGQLTILDRPGLEIIACECYRTVKQIYARLLS
jgi:CRP-like cAMP-binding protein